MDIHLIRKYWQDAGETLYTYSPSHIDKTKIDRITFTFFTTCGLPGDAAPFLSFSRIRADTLLTPNQIFKIDLEELENYLMFGSNGSGDPICVDTTQNNEIVYLNHDKYFDRIFINNSVLQFALCLTKYRDFIRSIIDTSSKKDLKRKKFSDNDFNDLKYDFFNTDKNCLTDKHFGVTN